MTEENKIEVVETRHECFCQSKGFRKFLVTATGTFVGVFCALSLFSALHKPPMPPCPFSHNPMMRPAMTCHYHHFDHHRRMKGDFHHKKLNKDRIAPDKVKIEVKG